MAHLILWNCLNISHAPVRPSGPHQLAYWLKTHGYNVKVIDFCHLLKTEDLVEITLKHIDSTTIGIGVSTTFWKGANNLEVQAADKIKEPNWVVQARKKLQHKNLKWILGGANSHSDISYEWHVLHGHAEDSLLAFMDEHYADKRIRASFDIKNLENCFCDDLFLQKHEVLPIELSRGCQFKCKFCRYPLLGKKKNTYIRDYNLIEDEFIENYERYGITKYFFLDDTVNESDEKIAALAEIAQRLPFKLSWFGYNRLDLIGVKRHTIDLLKYSGLKSAFFGIESFHPKASKVVGKGWNGAHAKDFLLELKDHWKDEINFHLAFIVGITGETSADLDKTQTWCIENNIASWRFSGLNINKGDKLIWKSEFDLNYGLYGYKFPIPEKDSYWVNNDWDADSASVKAVELTRELQPYVKPAVWLLGELSTLGYDLDELMNEYKTALDWEDIKLRNKTFIENYTQAQLK